MKSMPMDVFISFFRFCSISGSVIIVFRALGTGEAMLGISPTHTIFFGITVEILRLKLFGMRFAFSVTLLCSMPFSSFNAVISVDYSSSFSHALSPLFS